jgi:hypothetical protein
MTVTLARITGCIVLVRPSAGSDINTRMASLDPTLVSDLPTGIITVRLAPIARPVAGEFSLATTLARRSQHRAVKAYWDVLDRLLTRHGQELHLNREHDPDQGWCIYFVANDPEVVAVLHELACSEDGPGDLLAFDADYYVRQWLARIEALIGALGDETRITSNLGPSHSR